MPAGVAPVAGGGQTALVTDPTVASGTVGAFGVPLTVEVRDAGPEHLASVLDLPPVVLRGLGELTLVRPVFRGGMYGDLRERLGDGLAVRA